MQQHSTSSNASEILIRNAIRNELQIKMQEFLQTNEITVLEAQIPARIERPAYNAVISVSPHKAKQVNIEREEYTTQVRELSTIEIRGIPIRRSATEIAKLMRQRGYKARSSSVIRVAESLGIKVYA